MRGEVWVAHVLLVMTLAVAAPALAAESTPEDSTLVFDLANDNAVVEEHTARMLWNLTTDNIVPERSDVLTGWNSLYLEEPGSVSGTVIVDLGAGTITGDIVERWVCDNDCATVDGSPSWTTTRDTGWTATIVDGRVEQGEDGWTITGDVAIAYDTVVTSIENPSDCGGNPCYVCQERLCQVAEKMNATATLEGWIDGETLSLAFADQLENDVTAMDLSDMRRTQFYMSRFSLTMTGAVAPAISEPPPDEPAEPEPEAGTSAASDPGVELPAGELPPGVAAGAPPSDFGDDSAPEKDVPAATPAAVPADTDKGSSVESLILVIALVLGVAAAIVLLRMLFNAVRGRTPMEEAADRRRAAEATNWFESEATHTIEPGQKVLVLNPDHLDANKEPEFEGQLPLPPTIKMLPEHFGPLNQAEVLDRVKVIYHPSSPGIAVVSSGAQIRINPGQLTPIPTPFTPTHELVGTGSIHGQGDTNAYVYYPGTPVEIITTAGDRTLVLADDNVRMWIPTDRVAPAPKGG